MGFDRRDLATRPMGQWSLRGQYLLAFAVLGSVQPYLPVYMRDVGLSRSQVGLVLGTGSWAVVLLPMVLTLLADAHLPGRRLIRGIYLWSACALGLLLAGEGFWWILAAFVLHEMAFAPIVPLQDGLNFAAQARRREAGLMPEGYHRVRVYGTYGFILPSLVLFFLMRGGLSSAAAIVTAIGICGLGILNSLLLPRVEIPGAGQAKLPTLAALKAIFQPARLPFFAAMLCAQLASAAYYGFFTVYLVEAVGIARAWVGLIVITGVAVEIFFMLGFGSLARRWGLKGLIVVGMGSQVVRLSLLAMFPNVWVAVGTQVFHGIWVLVVHVVPPVYLDRLASGGFRNSVQGVYQVAVVGMSRVLGMYLAGGIAEWSLQGVFGCGAVLMAVGALVTWGLFTEPPVGDAEPEAKPPEEGEAT